MYISKIISYRRFIPPVEYSSNSSSASHGYINCMSLITASVATDNTVPLLSRERCDVCYGKVKKPQRETFEGKMVRRTLSGPTYWIDSHTGCYHRLLLSNNDSEPTTIRKRIFWSCSMCGSTVWLNQETGSTRIRGTKRSKALLPKATPGLFCGSCRPGSDVRNIRKNDGGETKTSVAESSGEGVILTTADGSHFLDEYAFRDEDFPY
jgi:hypothetical protein